MLAAAVSPAVAAGCAFEAQGEGRVAAVIDARTFRLEDGREVRLAGIEPVVDRAIGDRTSALAAIFDRPRGHACAAKTTRRTVTAASPPSCFSTLRHLGAERSCWRRARRWFRPP